VREPSQQPGALFRGQPGIDFNHQFRPKFQKL
jgi:hypothetical protein